MKNNSFLTFCFAFIPGAGQMYLGMMKRGVSLMLAFSAISMLAGVLYLPILMIFLPVLWFYSFFDTLNSKSIPHEQRLAQDAFLFCFDDVLAKDWLAILKKRHLLTGFGLIGLGVYLLYSSLLRPALWHITKYYPWLERIIDSVPSIIVAVAVIWLGLRLVSGTKKKSDAASTEDDFVEYGAKHDE